MQIFLDSADASAVERLAASGLVDGVTTNPTLAAKAGGTFLEVIEALCGIVDGPVSAEVAAPDAATMLREAQRLAEIAPNVAIKVPLTPAGLHVCREMSQAGRLVNVTLCFSPGQAILAAKAGAAFVSPFVGRLDDVGATGVGLIARIRAIYDRQPAWRTKILAASIRTPDQVADVAEAGADVATLPPDILDALYRHPLTEQGLARFSADWRASGQSIL